MCQLMCRWLCAKEIDKNTIPEMKRRVIELMCLLEKVFPPAFFDIHPLGRRGGDCRDSTCTVDVLGGEIYEGTEGLCLPSSKT